MNPQYPIQLHDIWDATDGGRLIFEHYYPQLIGLISGNKTRKNFSIRPDDKNPSCSLRLKDGIWFMKDFGGGDNKSINGITLIMQLENVEFGEAIKIAAGRFAPSLLNGSGQFIQPEPEKEYVGGKRDKIEVVTKDTFSAEELAILGANIKPEHCKSLSLYPVDYYITKEGTKIKSTATYPIFNYDYITWGRLYQPLSSEYRFMFVGDKPKEAVFGDENFLKLYKKVENGVAISTGNKNANKEKDEYDEDYEEPEDERLNELIICSGGSDALNVFANTNINVCWFNSESAGMDKFMYRRLKSIAKDIYILYDLDDTGIRCAYEIALKFLEIKIIWLPEDLKKFRDRKGKPCKDAKDFFTKYNNPTQKNLTYYFKELVRIAQPLQFWQVEQTPKTKIFSYEINNQRLYEFLNANGFCQIKTNQAKRGYLFAHVLKNIVSKIDEDDMVTYTNEYLLKWLRTNIEYYNINIVNLIHRSNQVKLESLKKLPKANLDFKSYGPGYDFLFFENTALHITKEGINPYRMENVNVSTFDFKIIKHNFRPEKQPPFVIDFSEEWLSIRRQMDETEKNNPGYKDLKEIYDNFPELDKYTLKINDNNFSYIKYVWNTGRTYWQKEEAGIELTDTEKKEYELNFISKICALGYLLYRHKEKGKPYGVYAMETEQSSLGTHLGGTGKSIFLSYISKVRNQVYIDGQGPRMDKPDTLFSSVEVGVTENVFFDDLSESVNLHQFMNTITGKMEVRALYSDTVTLEYSDSPKVCFNSNHGVKKFDASLKRRTWFLAFSNYYHSEDWARNLKERTPLLEFGKNLVDDYTDEEMNKFYNFMAYCLHTYLKIGQRVQPPMELIERRNIQRNIGDEFIWWADEFFEDGHLNVELDRNDVFEIYKSTLPKKIQEMIKINTFTNKIQHYAQYKGYIYNPKELLLSETEKERNLIRRKIEGKDTYFFHLRTLNESGQPEHPPTPAPLIEGLSNENFDALNPDERLPF